MNGLIKQLTQDKTVWWSTLLATAFLVLALLLILVFYHSLPPLVPLFNQLPWGTSRLSMKSSLLLPIALAFILLIGNTVLIKYIHEQMTIRARMLSVTSLLISILTFIFTLRIIQIIL